MKLRMGDGPPGNLPATGLDARAGYVNRSGIGVTWPEILAQPARFHLSITTDGSPAMCADVERGAMSDWIGYVVGYCEISQAGMLITRYGRPRKLWTAHRASGPGGADVAHICDASCWPGLPADFKADGTQWTNHGGAWDESLLEENFFDFLDPPTHLLEAIDVQGIIHTGTGGSEELVLFGSAKDNGNTMVLTFNLGTQAWDVFDGTDALKVARPTDARTYQLT